MVVYSVMVTGLSLIALLLKSGITKRRFRPEFFYYFTNLSALLCLACNVVLILAELVGVSPGCISLLTGVAIPGCVLYESIVFLVYNFILVPQHKGKDSGKSIYTLEDILMHVLLPIAVWTCWLLGAPKDAIPSFAPLIWLFYPVAYAIAAIVKGKLQIGPKFDYLDSFYPYRSLDMGEMGAAKFTINLIVMLVGITILGYGILMLGRLF